MQITAIPKFQTKSLNLKQNQKPAGKIVFFTGGKPSSAELSDVLKIANKVSTKNLDYLMSELAGAKTEGRGVGQPGIEVAKEFIGNKFKEYGLVPLKAIGMSEY